MTDQNNRHLRRELGVFGAMMMGLGSIIGTGVFVSIGIAAGVAGPAVILAIVLAAGVACCNALSSAQLAANHPVSGGTYEYGYRLLTPSLGFTAGWMFLLAKTASAATAALGFAGYLLHVTGWGRAGGQDPAAAGQEVAESVPELLSLPQVLSLQADVLVAIAAVIVLTLLVLSGIRRSSHVNIVIVSITLAALLFFVGAGLPETLRQGTSRLTPFFQPAAGSTSTGALLQAAALMFVAYTGYGRIATLGEEVREPRRTIPRAIVLTLIVSGLLYTAVAMVGVGGYGADRLAAATKGQAAPLESAVQSFDVPGGRWIVAVGAVTAMFGVLLNLILGLSRVLLAMGRRGDMPGATAKLDRSGSTPWVAVIVVGLAIAALASIGSVKTTWSFSAFTVLIYYALTNLAAIRLPPDQRLFHPVIPWVGLIACLGLAFWVERPIWLAGLGLIVLGLIWHRWVAGYVLK